MEPTTTIAPDVGIPNLYDWLIVGFVHDISDYKAYTDNLKQAIERAGAGKNNAVFLIEDVAVPDANNVTSYYLYVYQLTRLGNSELWKLLPVTGLNLDNSDKLVWVQAFQQIFSTYPAKRKMLITFSHGAAFGIDHDQAKVVRGARPIDLPDLRVGKLDVYFGDYRLSRQESQALQAANLLQQLPGAGTGAGPGAGLGATPGVIPKNDNSFCQNIEVMWITELAGALEKCLPNSSIDVLLMANCFMQVFDNGYVLSKKVKYLVGSEGTMDATGYDYFMVLNRVNYDPDITSKDLVREIVQDYPKMFNALNKADILSLSTIFANSLTYYPITLMVFEAFLDLLMSHMNESPEGLALVQGLKEIRETQMKSVSGSSSYQLIDAGLWIKLVVERFPHLDNMDMFYSAFLLLHREICTAQFIGQGIVDDDQRYPAKYGYSGISIYFPVDDAHHKNQEVTWCAYFDKAVKSPFKRDSKLDKFFDKYFCLVAKLP